MAYVFAGLTIAIAFGAPIGAYLGAIFSWRLSFMSVTVCSIAGLIGLFLSMPSRKKRTDSLSLHLLKALMYIFNPHLLMAALITALAYTRAFMLYSYISPLLYTLTNVTVQEASYMMLIYGVCAALGNLVGGKLMDKRGS